MKIIDILNTMVITHLQQDLPQSNGLNVNLIVGLFYIGRVVDPILCFRAKSSCFHLRKELRHDELM